MFHGLKSDALKAALEDVPIMFDIAENEYAILADELRRTSRHGRRPA